MINNQGWIRIHRKLLDDPMMRKPNYFLVWITLLLMANHQEHNFIWNQKNQICKRGQVLTGRKALAEKTGLSETSIENILKYLESGHQIGQQKTNKFRLITINNYTKYQEDGHHSGQLGDNKVTTKRQQSDTNKNDNNYNNDNNNILTDDQDIFPLSDVVKKTNINGAAEQEMCTKVFECYEKFFGVSVRARGKTRCVKILARLKMFTLDEVCKSIENYSKSAFHRGGGPQGWKADFDYCVRNDETVEKGLILHDGGGVVVPVPTQSLSEAGGIMVGGTFRKFLNPLEDERFK